MFYSNKRDKLRIQGAGRYFSCVTAANDKAQPLEINMTDVFAVNMNSECILLSVFLIIFSLFMLLLRFDYFKIMILLGKPGTV